MLTRSGMSVRNSQLVYRGRVGGSSNKSRGRSDRIVSSPEERMRRCCDEK